MAEQRPDREPAPRYEETTDPRNPPSSVLRPAARRSAVWTYVGGITAVFLIVAAVFAYRAVTDGAGDSELDAPEGSAVGTSGDPGRTDPSPGGFDPAPDRDSTRDELEFKGVGEEPQGPMPGLTAAPLTELGAMLESSPDAVAGRRIDIRDVEVERTDGNTLVIRDGDRRVSVVAPDGSPTVRPGQRIDVSGTVEPDGRGSARIRATRVHVE